MSKLQMYGLKSCDTCRKAKKELSAAGIGFDETDVRADGVSRDLLERWLRDVGEATLINRKSTTWRGLSDTQKADVDAGHAADLLLQHPTLIKRPVIETGDKVLVGWTEDVRSALGL